MLVLTRTLRTFPSVSLPSQSGGLPVEIALIAQLGHGSGDHLIESTAARQRGHAAFIDALDEPSARLGGVDLAKGDATSLYSFTVGAQGHPFHCHAGHRVFTAISGSGGTRLAFSTASPAQVEHDPNGFVRALRYVDIPADCLFTVRFGGGTWHRFAPLLPGARHPALFALSCHTNELGGELAPELRERVRSNAADIPALTQVLPAAVQALLDAPGFDPARVPTTALSVDAAAVAWAGRLCRVARGALGRLRAAWARWLAPRGFVSDNGGGRRVLELDAPPPDSLLREQLDDRFEHEDSFALTVEPDELGVVPPTAAMTALLDGFLQNRPVGVTRLMTLRNALVRPLRLRVSPLGCPVSSLLAPTSALYFASRFPVLAQRIDGASGRVQVVLGADDRHLVFRSCVGIERRADGRTVFTLETRVRTRNLFGRFYLAAIDRVHRGYVTPTMLRLAVDHAVRELGSERLAASAWSAGAARV
jgi:hypothetical protein